MTPDDAAREIAERTVEHERALEHADRALEYVTAETRRTDHLLAEYARADREREH